MSTSDKIVALQKYVEDEGATLLHDLQKELVQGLPDHYAAKLRQGLLDNESEEYLLHVSETLHEALSVYHRYDLEQRTAFKKDLLRFFSLMEAFIKGYRFDGALAMMAQYAKIFSPHGKLICGLPLKKCRAALEDGFCVHRYSIEESVCPVCGSFRRLCAAKPLVNGRCQYHGGNAPSGVLSPMSKGEIGGRAKLYAKALPRKLHQAYIEAITDDNFLSMLPEISALSTRGQELMSELGEVDLIAAQTRVNRLVKAMEKAIKDDKIHDAYDAAYDIRGVVTEFANNDRRWAEFISLSGHLATLSQTEQRRIEKAQQMVTVQEMYALQEQTLTDIRDAADRASRNLYLRMKNGEVPIKATTMRDSFLYALQSALNGTLQSVRFDDVDEAIEGTFE